MNKVNSILGAIISFFLLLGITFKIMHWPGAGVLIIISASSLSLYMIPVAIGNFLNYKKKTFIAICNGIGAFGGMILANGLLFKIMHWPGAGSMMLLGLFFSVITFLFFMILYITTKEPIQLSAGTFFSSICFGLLIYGVSIGGPSKNLLDNVVINSVNIENNIATIVHNNSSIVSHNFPSENNTIYEATNEINQYINNLKSNLYQLTDAIPKELADTISLNQIITKDNYDIPTYSLGIADPTNPIDGEFTATELKGKIRNFNSIIREFSAEERLISINDVYMNGQLESWETSMFYHNTLAQTILTLNQIQLEANVICNHILTLKLLQISNDQQLDAID